MSSTPRFQCTSVNNWCGCDLTFNGFFRVRTRESASFFPDRDTNTYIDQHFTLYDSYLVDKGNMPYYFNDSEALTTIPGLIPSTDVTSARFFVCPDGTLANEFTGSDWWWCVSSETDASQYFNGYWSSVEKAQSNGFGTQNCTQIQLYYDAIPVLSHTSSLTSVSQLIGSATSPTSTPTATPQPATHKGLSIGAVAGIVIGAVIAVALIIDLILFALLYHKRRAAFAPTNTAGAHFRTYHVDPIQRAEKAVSIEVDSTSVHEVGQGAAHEASGNAFHELPANLWR